MTIESNQYGLVIALCGARLKIDDEPVILQFPTEEAAVSWIVNRLIDLGEMHTDDSGRTCYQDESFDDKDSALNEWQFGLDAAEYCHIYEIKDGTAI